MEVIGKLHVKFPAQDVSASFRKRDFVLMIADNPQYPQYVSFQLTQEKCGLLDSFVDGAEIKVTFNLRGRQWVSPQNETKYFNTLEAWRIEPATVAAPQSHFAPTVSESAQNISSTVDVTNTSDADDLPF